jgi:predicted CXXCH cytochrome family protein
MRILLLLFSGLGVLLAQNASGPATSTPPQESSCQSCHAALGGDLQKPADLIHDDIHIQMGLTCASCHGGDPNNSDMAGAMSPAKGFIGVPDRQKIPEFCAKCHSDAVFMHRYNPSQRVDQLALYKTSVHGMLLAKGDTAVAVCTDCHSVHDIRAVKDPRAPVYPLNIPETCGNCHANKQHMAKYKIPTNQLAQYDTSVHWAALKGGDLSAPTCATCHGNHGATPPGVNSVARVCGTCHVVFDNLFQASPHKAAFEALGLGGCTVCHSNHAVHAPTPQMLGVTAGAVCVQCHMQGDPGYATAKAMREQIDGLRTALARAQAIVDRADQEGMEMSEAKLQLTAANGEYVKSRVQVHTLMLSSVETPVKAGEADAQKAYDMGVAALHERNVRRMGLLVSLLAIGLTLAGLVIGIRRLESKRSG